MITKRKHADKCARCEKVTWDEIDIKNGGWFGRCDPYISNSAWLCNDCSNCWMNLWDSLQVDLFNAFLRHKEIKIAKKD